MGSNPIASIIDIQVIDIIYYYFFMLSSDFYEIKISEISADVHFSSGYLTSNSSEEACYIDQAIELANFMVQLKDTILPTKICTFSVVVS